MPAIDLARLKTQAVRLADDFSNHMAFLQDLHEVLELYTNHTMRSSQVARRLSLPTYHTPAPVLRQIERELAPQAERLPRKGTTLAIELWKDATLESRLLAARLTGMIPPGEAMPLLGRLPEWLAQSTDRQVRAALLTHAFTRIRSENPKAFLILMEDWLKSPRNSLQGWGLQALIPLLADPHFEDLPTVFRILIPAFRSAGPVTQMDLQACLAALERNSFTETVSFMRNVTSDNPPPLMRRTFRRLLPGLSPMLQTALKEMLREPA